MRRLTTYFVAAFFLVFVSTPMLFHVLGFGEPFSADNRAIVTPQRPTAADLVDTDYYAGVTRYLNDTFPFRTEAVLVDAESDLLLGDSPNPTVTLGRDGWRFYTQTLKTRCFDESVVSRAASQLALAHKVVEATGRSFHFLIAPDKASIYSEMVKSGRDNGCRESNIGLLLAQIAETDAAGSLVALRDTLEVAKHTNLQYFKTDTHWNDFGASVAAEALINSVRPGLWAEEHLETEGTYFSRRDLMALIGLNHKEETKKLAVARPGVAVHRTVTGQGKESIISSTASGSLLMIEPTAAIIHDSFFESVEPMVAPYFSTFQAAQGFELVEDKEIQMLLAADIIVVESVERHVYNRLLDGFGDRMMVALAPDLNSTQMSIVADSPTSVWLTSDSPQTGSHLVFSGTPSDASITISINGRPPTDLPFVDGYGVVSLHDEAVTNVTISSPESIEIRRAYVVRMP
jgi:hypothetical protein